jgi:hypothetical protein
MSRLQHCLFLILLVGLAVPQSLFADCTPEEKMYLLRSGASPTQVEEACGRQGPGDRPQVARVCVTQWRKCQMVEPIPVGSSCFCPSQFGPLPGTAR